MNKQIRQFEKFRRPNHEVIRTIKIDVRVENVVLTDKFEWDINNPSGSPEEFALELVEEFGLSSKFINPIVFAIREQISEHQKSYNNENRVYYQMNRDGKQNPGNAVVYSAGNLIREGGMDTKDWEPCLKFLTEDELNRFEKNEERKLRYLQRKK